MTMIMLLYSAQYADIFMIWLAKIFTGKLSFAKAIASIGIVSTTNAEIVDLERGCLRPA